MQRMCACVVAVCLFLAIAGSASADLPATTAVHSASAASTVSAVDALIAGQVAALQQHPGAAAPAAVAHVLPQTAMVDALSAERVSHGLSPVRFSSTISAASFGYSEQLLHKGLFQHARHFIGAGFKFGGEILALELSHHPNIGQVISMWMQSPEHRPVILNPIYNYIGVGMVKGSFRGSPATMWVVRFGAR